MLKLFKVISLMLIVFFTSYTQVTVEGFLFESGEVIKQQHLEALPQHLNTVEKIQSFLESQNSILATYQPMISFEAGDYLLNDSYYFPGITEERFLPSKIFSDVGGQRVSVAQLIWDLSRGKYGSMCGSQFFDGKDLTSVCVDNTVEPINPAFILALIQKESRLVYGSCARPDADTNPNCPYSSPSSIQKLSFRLERATGYYCYETSDKTKSCWNENPNWKYYKGFFRQVYRAVRTLRIRTKTCEIGGQYAFSNFRGRYQVGATLNFGGQNVRFENGITCSMYAYTPHVSDKKLFHAVMRDLRGFENYRLDLGLPLDYEPGLISNQEL